MLSGRRNQYKKAALAAKKKGDIAMATKYAKTAKVSSDWILVVRKPVFSRTLDKSVLLKMNFLISQPKHMLWVSVLEDRIVLQCHCMCK